MLENFFDFFSKAASLKPSITDVLDIFVVTFIVYSLLKLLRDSRAFQLIKGLILLGIVYFFCYEFDLQAGTYIFRILFSNIFLIMIILFQQEFRAVLEHVGKGIMKPFGLFVPIDKKYNEALSNAIVSIARACENMSSSKTGALIVMENDVLLGDIAKSGTVVDAVISPELLGNIFFVNSPLHDGASIVRKGRLYAAGCVLPLTKNTAVSSDLGTRHRAALGLSEQSDAIVIVVSEETGIISVAREGQFERNLTQAQLIEILSEYFLPFGNDKEKTSFFVKKIKKAFKNEKKN